MSNQSQTEQRDQVLFAFHRACSDPSAEQIIEWVRQHPEFAEDIREHAAILKEWADREALPHEELSETMLSRSRSRALDALYNAQVAAAAKVSAQPARSFEQMMKASETDVPMLARELDIARSILAALVAGRMLAPVGSRLIVALMVRLAISQGEFDAALQRAHSAPRLGHAKADGTVTVIARSYEELIRDSNMSDERRQYWLSED